MTMKRGRIRYTAEQKQTIVACMMPPQNEAVAKIHKETKIIETTLYKWLKEAHMCTAKFIRWYNEIYLHSALRFVHLCSVIRTSVSRFWKIKEVYEEAKQKYPKRWTRGIHNWSEQEQVALNPMKEIVQE